MSRALSLAGFQVILIGRFWVTTEAGLISIRNRLQTALLIPRGAPLRSAPPRTGFGATSPKKDAEFSANAEIAA
jgi:hypothetical protein